ncbi:MAG: aromatic-L-amino-acid/L-tryptophan decarboxylase [Gaiellaceae bacterium]|nr:aromatic-L-amino-acid/L-tryptophan decarboxylase [Gaiellaceae bacterium]
MAGDRPDPALTFREDGRAAVDWAAGYLERVRDLPVLAQVEPGSLRAQLPEAPPEQGEPFSALLRDLDELILPAVTHWNHPRFFAYFPNTGSEPGILAELLIATLNTNGMLWRTSPASTELEQHVMDWVAQLLGLPRTWFGHLEDTASTSTMCALAAAREAGGGRRAVLCSDQAHSSVDKAARLLELELRKVGSDAEFRMRPDLLAEELGRGDVCAVVATVGTTSTTSIDPVPAIADLAAAHEAWLHVDAAYAGSAAVCPEFRYALDGVERADSFVVNAHKWLFTPVECSCLYTSRPDDLRRAFSLIPEYLRTSDGDAVNLMDYGPTLGRRMRALKLWAVLRAYGREGLQERIRSSVSLAALFEQLVRADARFEIVAPRPFSCVCFRIKGSDEENEALLERVNASGVCFLSHTALNGQLVLRFAVGNMRTTAADVELSWDAIRAAL